MNFRRIDGSVGRVCFAMPYREREDTVIICLRFLWVGYSENCLMLYSVGWPPVLRPP